MDDRHRGALRRIGQADALLQKEGREPERFHLQYTGFLDRVMDHPRWDPSWATPSEHTIDDLGDLGLLRVDSSDNKTRAFTLTMDGRAEALELLQELEAPGTEELDRDAAESAPATMLESGSAAVPPRRDPKKVAVMHGRDIEARRVVFDLIRRLGLEPLEWDQLVDRVGSGAPYNGEAVAAAFEVAQAVVVLLTPDDVGFLHPMLRGSRERDDDYNPTGQPRLNVVLEAGMALQSHPAETILVELGQTRAISDLAGRNTLRLDGTPGRFNSFANRLEKAGCRVERTGSDWLDAEGFTNLAALTRVAQQLTPASPAAIAVDRKTRIHARHVAVELETIRRTTTTLPHGSTMELVINPLPAGEWAAARDEFAEHAPTLYGIVSNAYVEADQLNKAAASAMRSVGAQPTAQLNNQLARLASTVRAALAAIESYLSGAGPPA